MSIPESALLQDLANVVTDSGIWVFAAGNAVISAFLAWVLLRFVQSMPVRNVCLVAAVIPLVCLIGAMLLWGTPQRDVAATLAFLVEPRVFFGLTIWFCVGWLSAGAVCLRVRTATDDTAAAIFE